MKKLIVIVSILGGIAILLAFTSSILLFINCDVSNALGIPSVILSVLLSVVAMLYTYLSGKETLKTFTKTQKVFEETQNTLVKIETQNRKLVDKINQDLIKGSYNEAGIEAVRQAINDE